MIRNLMVILMVFTISFQGRAQDLRLSNFNSNSMYMNPALTGVFSGKYRLDMLYRSQWQSWDSPFESSLFSIEKGNMEIGEANLLSIAGLIVNDRTNGILSSSKTNIGLSSSLIQNINENQILSFGLQGQIISRSISTDGLNFSNQITRNGLDNTIDNGEGVESGLNDYISYPDFNTGLYWRFYKPKYKGLKGLDLGLSIHHLFNPKETFYNHAIGRPIGRSLHFHHANKWALRYNVDIRFDFLYVKQASTGDATIGLVLNHRSGYLDNQNQKYTFSYGIKRRMNNDWLFLTAINYKNTYIFGVSYDIGKISELEEETQVVGSLEIRFTIRFGSSLFVINDDIRENMEY